MIQFFLAAAFILGSGATFLGCSEKKKNNQPDSVKPIDSFTPLPSKPNDLDWTNRQIQNFCGPFNNKGFDYLCKTNKTGSKPLPYSSCDKTENRYFLEQNAIEQGNQGNLQEMKGAACMAIKNHPESAREYRLLAALLHNSILDKPDPLDLTEATDYLSAAEKAFSFSSDADEELRYLTAEANRRIAEVIKGNEAIPFYQRAVDLYNSPLQKDLPIESLIKSSLPLIRYFLEKNDFSNAKRYFDVVFSLQPSHIGRAERRLLTQFIQLYEEALRKKEVVWDNEELIRCIPGSFKF